MAPGISIARLLYEDALHRIANSTWDSLWSRFITFRSASAAFLAILMIFRAIKFILDTIIHGYALYSLYGFSIHLLKAFWNSLTNLLLYLARKPKVSDTQQTDEEKADETSHQPPPLPQAPPALAKDDVLYITPTQA